MVDVEKLIDEVRKFPVIYNQLSGKYRDYAYKERIWNTIATNLGLMDDQVEELKTKWSSVRDQLRRTLQKRKVKPKTHKYKYEDCLAFLVPYLVERDGVPLVSKPQNVEEGDEYESFACKEETFTDVHYHQRSADEGPISEDENILAATNDNSFMSDLPSSSQAIGINDQFARTKNLKRKISRPEEILQSSSSQLIAHVIAEIETNKKRAKDDPVDAFLGGIAPSLRSLNPHLFHEAKGRIFAVVQEMELRQLQMNTSSERFLMSNVQFSSTSPPQDE